MIENWPLISLISREKDGNYRFIADEDAVGVDASIISGWFTAVPSEPTTTP